MSRNQPRDWFAEDGGAVEYIFSGVGKRSVAQALQFVEGRVWIATVGGDHLVVQFQEKSRLMASEGLAATAQRRCLVAFYVDLDVRGDPKLGSHFVNRNGANFGEFAG